MAEEFYPPEIQELPEIDISFPGVRGRLLQGPEQQVVFFDIDPTGEIKPHSHGAQWGVILDGEMELTIGEETRTYRKGDTYYIPTGVTHSARFLSRTRAIDFFSESDRHQAKQT